MKGPDQYEVVAAQDIEQDDVIGEITGRMEYQSQHLNPHYTVKLHLPTDDAAQIQEWNKTAQAKSTGRRRMSGMSAQSAKRRLKAAKQLQERFEHRRVFLDTMHAGNELRFTNSAFGIPGVSPNAKLVTVALGGQVRFIRIFRFRRSFL
jgi:hypothetical protein